VNSCVLMCGILTDCAKNIQVRKNSFWSINIHADANFFQHSFKTLRKVRDQVPSNKTKFNYSFNIHSRAFLI
jgi:hypothetical protein